MATTHILSESYSAVTITLTAQDTNYNLLALLQAINPRAGESAYEMTLQVDPGNAAGAEVDIGDAQLSATRRGYTLFNGSSRTYRGRGNDIPLGTIYLRSPTGAGVTVNVELLRT